MKLSKPGDIEEEPSGEPTEPSEVTIQTEHGEMPLTDAVRQNSEMLDAPEDYGVASDEGLQAVAEEMAETREMVKQQRKMIGELIETVEILTMAVENGHSIEHAHDVWADRGNETALEWEEDAYEFKNTRYE